MQIAQVVPNVRTGKEAVFDYAIPFEILPEIKIGLLVEVIFNHRKVQGLIINLRKSSPIAHLSPILKIIDPIVAVDFNHLELARWMADYYLAPLGKTIFENTVPPARRTIKKNWDVHQPHLKILKPPSTATKVSLVVGDFLFRSKFYMDEIKTCLNLNKNVLIIVPDLSLAKYFSLNHLGVKPQEIVFLSADLSKVKRWSEWNKVRSGQIKIVLGSLSAFFAPLPNLGLVIVDQEENETYKNGQTPRFNLTTVVKKMGQISGAEVVFGTLTPNVETVFNAQKEHYTFVFEKSASKAGVTTVDMNSQKSIISETLQEAIQENLQKKEKILLVLNRKGSGHLICQECGWKANCPSCGLPLVPVQEENRCFHCQKSFPLVENCPNCHSTNLKNVGLGTLKLKQKIEKLFPNTKAITIEKDIGFKPKIPWDIAIATSYALKFPLSNIGLVTIIDADLAFNFPDFNSIQSSFQTFYKFLKLGKSQIIQTHFPDHYLIKALQKLSYRTFYQEELSQRKKSQFPPYQQLIKLEYRSNELEFAQAQAEKTYDTLQKLTQKDPQTIFSKPFVPYLPKSQNKHRLQIVIKTKQKNSLVLELNSELKNFLKVLPKGWIVDVDPISLI